MPISLNSILKWPLFPLSAVYGGIIEIRNLYYNNHFLPVERLPKPTISVGNISAGGTGKTPVVGFIAQYIDKMGKKVAILSRGYGRQTKSTVLLSNNNLHRVPYSRSGDEPRLLAQKLRNGFVVIDGNRIRGGKLAIKKNAPDFFILDDGFQHRRVYRDLDIVTMDATDIWGGGFMLPAGKLREPLSQLRRADLIWITKTDQAASSLAEIKREIRKKIKKPLIFSEHSPKKVCSFYDQTSYRLHELKGKKVVAFCGIADHNSFKNTLLQLGTEILVFQRFRDHHRFRPGEISKLLKIKECKKADWLITTEKDAVRIDGSNKNLLKSLFFLEIEINLVSGLESLEKMIENIDIIL